MTQSLWGSAIAAYVHYLSFMVAFAALVLESHTLKPDLNLAAARRLLITDVVYGLSAATVLITGVLRVLYFGKGREYYLSNPIFYTKVGLFVLIGLLSLYPTISFLLWLKDLRLNKPPTLELATVQRLTWVIRIELLGFLLLPLLAAMLARGMQLSLPT